MWAWLPTLDLALQGKTIQSLPRELSLGDDGTLRIAPLRELETLRGEAQVFDNVALDQIPEHAWGHHEQRIVTTLSGEAHEIRLSVAREQADRKRLGLRRSSLIACEAIAGFFLIQFARANFCFFRS